MYFTITFCIQCTSPQKGVGGGGELLQYSIYSIYSIYKFKKIICWQLWEKVLYFNITKPSLHVLHTLDYFIYILLIVIQMYDNFVNRRTCTYELMWQTRTRRRQLIWLMPFTLSIAGQLSLIHHWLNTWIILLEEKEKIIQQG